MNEVWCFVFVLVFFSAHVSSLSQPFPLSAEAPVVEDFLPNPDNIYYCSSDGDNENGDGSIENPWSDLKGGQDVVGPGDLVYFRGGNYTNFLPRDYEYEQGNSNWALNRLLTDGTEGSVIVISNYPNERVFFSAPDYVAGEIYEIGDHITYIADKNRLYTSTRADNSYAPDDSTYGVDGSDPYWERTRWQMSLWGDNQKLIASKVDGEYGFVVYGGISIGGDNIQVSGVEFVKGAAYPDGNPAMLSITMNDGADGTIYSHNYFHDALPPVDSGNGKRMVALKFFRNSNSLVEYNLFKDNYDVYQYGTINFKDSTTNTTVRHNKFIDSKGGINYFAQGNIHGDFDVYGNLFYNVDVSFTFANEAGSNIRIHDNVASEIGYSFFNYINADHIDTSEYGEYYDNIIYGLGFSRADRGGSAETDSLPDFFDYNIWASVEDQNNPLHPDLGKYPLILPEHYFDNSIIAPGEVSYDSVTMTVRAEDDYAGRGAGRYGGDIGGFVFEGECLEDWSCSEWSTCLGGFENRTCVDLGGCSEMVNESKACDEEECDVVDLDRPCDGVQVDEVILVLESWSFGEVSLGEVLRVIGVWKE